MPVYKRGDVWYADVQVGGQRIKQSAGPDATKADAKALEAEIRTRLKNRRRHVYYLDDALAKWLDEYAANLKGPEKYAQHAKQLLPYVQGRLLTDAPEVAREYANDCAHLRPATINQRLRILRRVANLAFAEWRWLDLPVGKRIRMLAERNRRSVYLSPEQIEAVCIFTYSQGVADAIRFAAFSGVRLGELVRITRSHVVGGVLYLDAVNKAGKQRTIPLPDRIKDIPLPIRATRNQIQDQYRKATRKVGLKATFHDLRHTYASLLIQAGASLSAVQELMGHSTIAITKDLYGHLEKSHLEAAVKLLNGYE